MSDIVQVVRALCASPWQDATGNVIPLAISPAIMRGAFASVLDGGAPDLEVGALMTVAASLEAQQAGRWFAEIVLGLSDAIRDRMTPLAVDGNSAPVVILPNYGDDDISPATPLIALLLRRLGVRVLIHGAIETHGGLLNCSVLREFGILPAATRSQAGRQLTENGLALLPVTLFSPGLAAMLSLRNRLGIRTPAHALAKMLMPVMAPSTPAVHALHMAPWLKLHLAEESVVLDTPALLVSVPDSSEGGSFAGSAQISFRDAEKNPDWEVLMDTEGIALSRRAGGAFDRSPEQYDPRAWTEWTRQRIEGKAALPQLAASHLACCLYGCGYAPDFHQAKAIAAVEMSTLAA
ncbi:MAG: hypothetical protein ABI905_04015 [Betaproteobacteria bacterium]